MNSSCNKYIKFTIFSFKVITIFFKLFNFYDKDETFNYKVLRVCVNMSFCFSTVAFPSNHLYSELN